MCVWGQSYAKREHQLRKWHYQISLQEVCMTFLEWWLMWKGPANWGAVNPEQVSLWAIRKQAEQARRNKPICRVPPWCLVQFLSLIQPWVPTLASPKDEPQSVNQINPLVPVKMFLQVLALYHTNRNPTTLCLSFPESSWFSGFYSTLGWRPGKLVKQWLMVKNRRSIE